MALRGASNSRRERAPLDRRKEMTFTAKPWRWVWVPIVCLFVAAVTGCGPKTPSEIKIGVSLPLSGDAAVWGKSQKDGYDLALSQINAASGIDGKKVVLIYEDDAGLPKQGVSALRKLLDVDKVQILTGVANSSVALAYIPIINERHVLFVSSGASSPKLTGASKYFFRTWPSDIAEALAMAKYAYGELGLRKVGILYINNDYGTGLSGPLANTFKSLGGTILGSESFEQGATDFRAQLTKLQSYQPQAIYLAGNPREMGRAIKQARELGITTPFLSISTLNDREVLGITGPAAIAGTIITDASFDPKSDRPEAKRFMSDFRAMFRKDPGILANTAYDALMVIADAIGHEKTTDPDKMQAYLHGMRNYAGVSGAISFSEGGDVNRPIRISRAEGGKFVSLVADYRWY
jgi:branched-chain amino acid transport system substrate-binding protein